MANDERRIGLALSGGGHRAAAFHFGVLARLAVGGLLDEIEVVSTVSGGSIALALVYAANKNLWIKAEDYIQRIVPQLRSALTGRNMEIDIVLQMLKPPFPILFARRANAMAAVLRDKWGVTGRLCDVAPRPQWIINTMTIETGKNWRFDRYVMGDYVSGYTPVKDFRISDAVAASGGFPVFIGPFTLKADKYLFVNDYATARTAATTSTVVEARSLGERPGMKNLRRLHFWDGGMYDNLGVQPLIRRYRFYEDELRAHLPIYRELRQTDRPDLFDISPQSSPALDFLVVSDASPRYMPKAFERWLSFWRLATLPVDHIRMIYSAQVVSMMRVIQQRAQKHGLLPQAGAYLQFDNTVGYVLSHSQERDNLLPGVSKDEIERIASESLSQGEVDSLATYGTRLKKMAEAEFDGMFQHGYEQTDATLYAYNPGLGAQSQRIPFDRDRLLPLKK